MSNTLAAPAVTVTTPPTGVITVTPATPATVVSGVVSIIQPISTNISDAAGNPLTSLAGSLNVNVTDFPVLPAAYSAAISNITIAPPGTDLFVITGSPDKLVKVYSVTFSATINSGTSDMAFVTLVKRNSLDSGGNQPVDIVAHDSDSPAPVATVYYYDNAPSLGNPIGLVASRLCPLPQNNNPTPDDVTQSSMVYEILTKNQPIILHKEESLCISIVYTQGNKTQSNASVTWTEE